MILRGPTESKISRKIKWQDRRATEKKNEMLINMSEHISTYTMAKLAEALGGQNSMSKPSQQLPTTKHRCLMITLVFKYKLVKEKRSAVQNALSRESQKVLILPAVGSLREQFWGAFTKRFIRGFDEGWNASFHPED